MVSCPTNTKSLERSLTLLIQSHQNSKCALLFFVILLWWFSYWSRNNSIELYPAQLFDNFAQKWTLAKSHIDSSHPWTFLRECTMLFLFKNLSGDILWRFRVPWLMWFPVYELNSNHFSIKKDLYNHIIHFSYFTLKNITPDVQCIVVY